MIMLFLFTIALIIVVANVNKPVQVVHTQPKQVTVYKFSWQKYRNSVPEEQAKEFGWLAKYDNADVLYCADGKYYISGTTVEVSMDWCIIYQEMRAA